jgi:hypothetical protein
VAGPRGVGAAWVYGVRASPAAVGCGGSVVRPASQHQPTNEPDGRQRPAARLRGPLWRRSTRFWTRMRPNTTPACLLVSYKPLATSFSAIASRVVRYIRPAIVVLYI